MLSLAESSLHHEAEGLLSSDPLLKSVVACIPAYNEEIAIGSVVLRARRFVDRVVVIDDCSTDATAEVARLAGADVLTHGRNLGYGGALRTAFQVARRLDADVLVILDGDGQHNPEEIPVLVKGIGRGRADVIVGTRFHATQESHIPWYRNLGIQLITRLTNLGMVTKVSDAQSGFRAFSSKAIEALNINELDMGASTELLLESSANGLTIEEVPISVRYDLDGSSKNPLSHGLGILAQLFRYVENKHPLMVFSLPGAIVFISGFLQGLQILVNYESGAPAPLGLALISIVFILIGTLSIYTGMILHAISGRGLPIGSKKQSPVDGQTVVENVG